MMGNKNGLHLSPVAPHTAHTTESDATRSDEEVCVCGMIGNYLLCNIL